MKSYKQWEAAAHPTGGVKSPRSSPYPSHIHATGEPAPTNVEPEPQHQRGAPPTQAWWGDQYCERLDRLREELLGVAPAARAGRYDAALLDQLSDEVQEILRDMSSREDFAAFQKPPVLRELSAAASAIRVLMEEMAEAEKYPQDASHADMFGLFTRAIDSLSRARLSLRQEKYLPGD